MTPAAFTDGVLRLTQSSDATRGRALLRAATELFVSGSALTQSDVHIYEELALQLLRITPFDDRKAVAGLLARRENAPAAVLRALLADDPAIASLIIQKSRNVPDVDLIALVATGSPGHLEALTQRPNPSPALVEALVRRLPSERLPLLIANPNVQFPAHVMAMVVAAAKGHPDVAIALSRRLGDIDDADLIDLFLDLDGIGRRRALLALEVVALREFAAGKPMPSVRSPDPDLVSSLARTALSRDLDRIASQLALLTGLEPALARRILVDKGGEPLAVALKAAGLDAPTATRVLLFSGEGEGRDYFAVKRLLDVYESVSNRSAVLLVDRWRSPGEPLPRRRPRHVPQTEEGTPVRVSDRRGLSAPRPAVPSKDRTTG